MRDGTDAAKPVRRPDPIRRQKLSEQVVDRLIDMINGDDMQLGSELPSERELMRLFAVGRPAVRDAMSALAQMGLIDLQPGGRAKVREPTAEHLISQIDRTAWQMLIATPDGPRHLREARSALELAIIMTAIDHGTESEIEAIGTALEANRRALADGNKERFVKTDIAFHLAIARASHSPIYVALTRAVLGWLMEYRARIVSSGIDQRAAFAEHEQLFARIEARDHAGAMEVLRQHLARISGPDDRHLLATLTAMAKPLTPAAANANIPLTPEVDP